MPLFKVSFEILAECPLDELKRALKVTGPTGGVIRRLTIEIEHWKAISFEEPHPKELKPLMDALKDCLCTSNCAWPNCTDHLEPNPDCPLHGITPR